MQIDGEHLPQRVIAYFERTRKAWHCWFVYIFMLYIIPISILNNGINVGKLNQKVLLYVEINVGEIYFAQKRT